LLLSRSGQNVVIDTTPDFRQQALRVGLDRLDAILLTHGHADHILGFDDIRPYNMRQKAALPVYSTEETFDVIRRAFAYVFDERPTLSTVPSVTLNVVNGPFELMGIPFIPVPLRHGDLEVLGFRFGQAAYLTDFSELPDSSARLLEGAGVTLLGVGKADLALAHAVADGAPDAGHVEGQEGRFAADGDHAEGAFLVAADPDVVAAALRAAEAFPGLADAERHLPLLESLADIVVADDAEAVIE